MSLIGSCYEPWLEPNWHFVFQAHPSENDENSGRMGDTEDEVFNIVLDCDQEPMPNIFESSAADRDTKVPLLNHALCSCSSSTAGDALLYCLALGIRHNLSWPAMVDIVKMVNLLYGYEAVDASKYYLQKLFYMQKTAKYHLYCSVCETYLGVKGEEGVEMCCECSKDANSVDPLTFFFLYL